MNFDAYQGRAAALYSLVSADLVDARRGTKAGCKRSRVRVAPEQNVGASSIPALGPLILRSSIIARDRASGIKPPRQTVLIVDKAPMRTVTVMTAPASSKIRRRDRRAETAATNRQAARQHDCREMRAVKATVHLTNEEYLVKTINGQCNR
jgi:hypothetical protein